MPDRFLRYPEVIALVGFSRSTVERMVTAGTFPKPRKIGMRAVAWLESDIATWMQQPGQVEYNAGPNVRPNSAQKVA